MRLLGGLVLVVVTLVASSLGCNEESDCRKVCLRVARCRQEARVGEKMLGERDLPPDARCMHRCENDRPTWEKCELAHRNCASLRGCYGSLR